MNDFFQLSLEIDEQKLAADFHVCMNMQWNEHFNEKDYSGSWTVIALRSQSGKTNDIVAHNSDLPFIDTPLLSVCNYFRKVLDEMKFEKETVRLLRLKPGSIIKEHRDRGLAYRNNCFRLHIPVLTDASVIFKVGGKNIPMKKGECWYADFDLPHSVMNESSMERVHLVIDGKRNEWTDALFGKAGYDFNEEMRMKDHSIETKKQMIENLLRIKTASSEELIRKLQSEIIASGQHSG